MNDHKRDEKRALDAVAQCLVRHLMVPHVYFDAEWPDVQSATVDVLAIDRAGTGDVHVAELRFSAQSAAAAIQKLRKLPAQFLWFAYFRESAESVTPWQRGPTEELYSAGAGRVGIIEVVRMAGDDLGASIIVKAERFHVPRSENVREYVEHHAPHIMFD